MLMLREALVSLPCLSRELTLTRAVIVLPGGSILNAALRSLMRTGFCLPAATVNGESPITRQPRAQRAARAFLPRLLAAVRSSMTTRPRQPPTVSAGHDTLTGTALAKAGSSTVAGLTTLGLAAAGAASPAGSSPSAGSVTAAAGPATLSGLTA